MSTLLATRVVEHQAHIFRKFWRGSAFAYVLNPVLFLAALGLGVGGLVKQGNGEVDGIAYLAFVTPGLMAASAMQGAAAESLWPVMAGTKWVRVFHAMVATPIRPGDVYLGVVTWTAVRAAVGATVFLIVATILGGVLSWWAPLAIPPRPLDRARVRRAAERLRRDPGHGLPLPRRSCGSASSRSSCSPAPSSRSPSSPAGCSRCAGSLRSGTACSCAAARPPVRSTGPRRSRTSLVLERGRAGRGRLGHPRLHQEARDMSQGS